jgi:hypothetical protein
MPREGARDDPRVPGDAPILVEVRVLPGPRGGALSGQIRRLGLLRLAVGAVALVVLVGAFVGVVAGPMAKRTEQPLRPQPQQTGNVGPVGVAAAYRYPRACLGVTISRADPAYAAVRLNRVSPCWRYGVYVTAIFHRVAGMWRLAADVPGAGCSITSIPAAVRAQLGVCEPQSGGIEERPRRFARSSRQPR